MEEITNPLTKHISVGELADIIVSHKKNIDTTNAKEVQMMSLLETAMFHINELMITIDKTREDLNKSINYSDNLRQELKNLIDVANSYLSESSKIVYEN